MKNKLTRFQRIVATLVFAVSLCFLAACQTPVSNETSKTNSSIETKTNQTTADKNIEKAATDSTLPTNATAGVCTNKYFPVADGDTRRYKTNRVGEGADETVYKQSYQSGADTFSETQNLQSGKKLAVKVDWNCLSEGLRTASFGQLLQSSKVGMTLESKKAEGVTVLKDTDWTVGKKWTSEYDLGGQFDMKIVKGEVTGKVVLNHEIVAMDDKVKVPAGEFSAAKVKVNVVMNINFQGKKLPSENFTMINWHSPGIGIVKQEVTGTLGTSSLEYLGK